MTDVSPKSSKGVTKLLISDFKLYSLGYDFMGFTLTKKTPLAFHHLIIPKRDCARLGLGKGCFKWNGAILGSVESSHEYLHLIEMYDRDLFLYITRQMVEENVMGRLDLDCLMKIHTALLSFEREHEGDKTKKGKILIKETYLNRIGFMDEYK